MRASEILALWCFFQVGNLIAWATGTSAETAICNLYFSGFFAIFIAGVQRYRETRKDEK